ncbi:MAG TPA: GNAT family N-acetyltransferase, partial [Alphaproteobacteria bacterium]
MKAFDFRITHEEEPEANVIIEIGLETANNDSAIALARPLNVLVYDRESLIGGVIGHTVEGTLIIKYVWVDAACRSQGMARKILGKLESEAQGRGCNISFVDVMSYQAPD